MIVFREQKSLKRFMLKSGFISKEHDPQVIQDIPIIHESLSTHDLRWMKKEYNYFSEMYDLQICGKYGGRLVKDLKC